MLQIFFLICLSLLFGYQLVVPYESKGESKSVLDIVKFYISRSCYLYKVVYVTKWSVNLPVVE